MGIQDERYKRIKSQLLISFLKSWVILSAFYFVIIYRLPKEIARSVCKTCTLRLKDATEQSKRIPGRSLGNYGCINTLPERQYNMS